MPNPIERELLEFFRTNTKDLSDTTSRWFQLPNKVQSAVAALDPDELRRRILAGEDINTILGMTIPTISNKAQDFINQFVSEINGQVRSGRGEEAVQFASTRLVLVAGQFRGVDLSEVRKKVYEGRATAQGYLVERGSLRIRPAGDKLRSFCALSLTVDWMRADLEAGLITDRARTIAEGFGYAGMELLQRKAVGKWAGQEVEILYKDTLRPTRRFSTPADPEIRDMQRKILARLIPDKPSQ